MFKNSLPRCNDSYKHEAHLYFRRTELIGIRLWRQLNKAQAWNSINYKPEEKYGIGQASSLRTDWKWSDFTTSSETIGGGIRFLEQRIDNELVRLGHDVANISRVTVKNR